MEKFSVFFMITQTLLNWVLESQALLRRLDRTTHFLEKINRNLYYHFFLFFHEYTIGLNWILKECQLSNKRFLFSKATFEIV